MQSSLTRVLPRTSGSSPCPPVSVSVRAVQCSPSGLFSAVWCTRLRSAFRRRSPSLLGFVSVFSRYGLPAWTCFSISTPGLPPASPLGLVTLNRRWILRQLSIAFACCSGLGPGLPWVDERCPGILRLSVGRILTALFATHTGILSSIQSTCPSGHASSLMERSPTHAFACRSFGSVLEPRVSSAQSLSASELLRTLLMVAASEPTSWLFLKSYILPHLVRHSGP